MIPDHAVEGPDGAPLVLLIPSLGTTGELWAPQVPVLRRRFRVVRPEHRGHGPSPAPPGPYTIADLGRDLVDLLDDLGVERASLCGVSLGGMLAMWVAAHHPERVDRLVLACTAPALPPESGWRERAATVRAEGVGVLLPALIPRWFADPDQAPVEEVSAMVERVQPEGYAGCCEAIAAMDLAADLADITAPTLVIAGGADPVVPPTVAVALQGAIAGAGLVVLAGAAHLANLDRPEAFTAALVGHLWGDAAARGEEVRRAVLGAEHVAGSTKRNAEFVDLITRYAWGEIWTRPGLDRATRSGLTIAMLVAQSRWEELPLHLHGAVRNGLTRSQIDEILLQTAVYCGVPAANTAFAIAERELGVSERAERTTVGIVGAGPAGLVLSHLLARAGIESVVLEVRDRAYVESRVRAGVLEQCTVELLDELGLTERLHREGLVHHGVNLQFDGERHRIDFAALTGRSITVYGQQEVVKDLIAARLEAGGDIRFEVEDVQIHDLDGEEPSITFRGGRLGCKVIAGCDGFHGVCRPSIPPADLRTYEHDHPFAWLGILAQVAPSSPELVYASSDRGFALLSARSPTVSRCYLQVGPDEDLAAWPDDRIWDELQRRTAIDGWTLQSGPIIERGITAMRSFVCEPMRHGRLFLAGDAAHIVPPTGAKGMNLAIADVKVLSDALVAWLRRGDEAALDAYGPRCLQRVWRAQEFATFMTTLLHLDPAADDFDRRLQRARQRYVVTSPAMATALAENYVGLPLASLASS